MEEKILNQFKKKMQMEDRTDLIFSVDWSNWRYGDYTCEIMERADYGRVWSIECYSTGRIKSILEL